VREKQKKKVKGYRSTFPTALALFLKTDAQTFIYLLYICLIIAKTDNQKLHFTCFWLFDSIIFAIDEI
jgi:hypothetical protein